LTTWEIQVRAASLAAPPKDIAKFMPLVLGDPRYRANSAYRFVTAILPAADLQDRETWGWHKGNTSPRKLLLRRPMPLPQPKSAALVTKLVWQPALCLAST
jgi:hypothetical protein